MITVNYFGNIAEAAQSDSEILDVKSMKLEELLSLLDAKYGLRKFQFQVAVNRKIVSRQRVLTISEADEIALLPPFAGG
ncbi:MoaD/ThiS family protein [Algoriphagus sp. AGSA1]|uniref:MoaD/ThiS family protein n=1 Tax=Algoriphagus sp. AGSA1 TaxID=2907213 RepID=UPI001F30375D|nr:MoaD/ThiS family protein [Algoriphagus sp. AGSA1]MCE7055914.1 MoaD/ThiS family protein [Algoriphagus sp. AGSA1]